MSSAASQVRKSKELPKEIYDPTSKHQVINIEVEGNKALALIDPQTTGGNLMSTNYTSVYNLPLIQTLEPIQVNLALKGSKGVSTHYIRMKIKIGTHEQDAAFLIVALDDGDVFLGHPLLRDIRVVIDVSKALMTISLLGGQKETVTGTEIKRRSGSTSLPAITSLRMTLYPTM